MILEVAEVGGLTGLLVNPTTERWEDNYAPYQGVEYLRGRFWCKIIWAWNFEADEPNLPAGVKSKGKSEKMPAILAIMNVLKCAWFSAAKRLHWTGLARLIHSCVHLTLEVQAQEGLPSHVHASQTWKKYSHTASKRRQRTCTKEPSTALLGRSERGWVLWCLAKDKLRTVWNAIVIAKVWIGLIFGITAKTVSPTSPREVDATPEELMESSKPSFPATKGRFLWGTTQIKMELTNISTKLDQEWWSMPRH
jgi:hypothetical protein